MSGSRIFLLWVGLAVGSFIYQAWLTPVPNYGVALERSFFQGCALLTVWLAMKLGAS